MKKVYGSDKVDAVVFGWLKATTDDFDQRDWALLALAALDQAGVPASEQELVKTLIAPFLAPQTKNVDDLVIDWEEVSGTPGT